MEGNVLEVKLWEKTVGLLSWDKKRGCATFQFDVDFVHCGWNISPITAPLSSPLVQNGFPIFGNKEKLYAGLPEFLADSLPDRWGNQVFQKWLESNHLNYKDVNAVDRLSFIGKRGMGALEFQPAHMKEDAPTDIHLHSLYELADQIFSNRQDVSIDMSHDFLLEDLYKIGTSAGGQRPKAIIAIDERTRRIRSGQAQLPPEFKYYILKFDCGNGDFPYSQIEMAYYLMAKDAGIQMMPSKLIEINGRQHFLTQRFDRKYGHKIHTQTLAAMSSLADTYEDLFIVGRRIGLTSEEQAEQYKRMVFNILAANVDDHTKNFSFMMDRDGAWHITPAYDLIFSVDLDSRFFRHHELSLLGKRNNITRQDLLLFAKRQDIKDADALIEQVAGAVNRFRHYAEIVNIPSLCAERMEGVLKECAI